MLSAPITAKGEVLRTIVMGRLSREKETQDQTQATIDASFRYAREFVERSYDGRVEYRELGEQISGLKQNRRTIIEAVELIESGEWDLVVTEDLSRIYRSPALQYDFVNLCVDVGVRLICIADGLDTADENWEVMMGAAALRHSLHIPDTRRRQKRSAKHSFHRGGMVQRVRFGYKKVSREDAAAGTEGPVGLRIARLPEWQPLFDEIRMRLVSGTSPSAIVDLLNRRKIPVGPSAGRNYWHLALLKNLLRDPVLHGVRMFRRYIYVPLQRQGGHRREVNPTPEISAVPELAFMSLEQQEEMLGAVGWKINWQPKASKDAPTIRCRSRAVWPQLAATCSACGSNMVVMGTFLKCSKATKAGGATCWNHVQAPLAIIRTRMTDWICQVLARDQSLREVLLEAALAAIKNVGLDADESTTRLSSEERSLQRQLGNLAEAIKNGAENSSTLISMLNSVEEKLAEVRSNLESARVEAPALPTTIEALEERLEEMIAYLVETSVEFAEVLRMTFPRFEIVPVQALDTGQVRPRAVLYLSNDLASSESKELPYVEFDLFSPPEHIRLVKNVVEIREKLGKASYKKIAGLVGTSYMTVKRAFGYWRRMQEMGVAVPFQQLTAPPENASRWRNAV